MAEAISNFIAKRRNRSSGSEDEANEPKKLRNTVHENESQIAEVEEEQNVIAKAPEMTDDVASKLEVILVKLNNIEVSVKNVETNLASLEKRMTKLEEAELSTKCDIEAVNKRIDTLDEKLTNSPTIPAIKDQMDKFSSQLLQLRKKQEELAVLQEQLKTKDLYLEAYSRRETIKFVNIPEEDEREDTEEIIRGFLERELGFMDARTVEMQRVHRVGKNTNESRTPRAILAKFLRAKDCDKILSLGFRLRDTNSQMYRDLPREIVTRRKAQMATLKKARQHKVHAVFSKAEPDKLYIGGKFWPVGKPFDIEELDS